MDFTYDDEQQALREAVRSLVGRAYESIEHRRQVMSSESGFDRAMWARMAEMGLLGLPFDEEDGGVGAGPVEVSIVAEELGRVLAPEPFLTSVVWAGGLVQAAGTAEQRAEVLTALAEGQTLLMPALAEPGGRWTDGAEHVVASERDGEWTLTGVKEPVPNGAEADLLVVSAALPEDGGTGLFLVDGTAPGLMRTGYRTHDGARAAKLAFEAVEATPLGEPSTDVTAQIAFATDMARVASAGEAIGAMESSLRITTEYLISRKQFGVTLNTFQALTFRAADMYVQLELAKSLAVWATMVAAYAPPEQLSDAASRAALQVNRAARRIGQEAIQLHGGIGLTAEYSIGHYTSRLLAREHLLGDADFQLKALAGSVGDHDEFDPLS